MTAGRFRMLPFAGITQIRFEGVSHPAGAVLQPARRPSVAPPWYGGGNSRIIRRWRRTPV